MVRKDAIEVLGEMGDKRAVESLIRELENDDRMIRVAAIEALWKIGDIKAAKPLVTYFISMDRGPDMRMIANALGQIGDKGVIEDLIKSLERLPHRENAAYALGKIRDKRAVQPLESILDDPLRGCDPFYYVDDVKGKCG